MTWGDNEVLQNTRQVSEEGKVRLEVTLPSGRELTTELMDPDDARKHVIDWCGHVRNAIQADKNEEEAKRKRGSVEPEDIADEAKEEAAEEATDPIAYAEHQRDMYQERVNVLEERISDLKVERTRCREHLEKWDQIVRAFRGETDE